MPKRLTQDDVRAIALALPGAEERSHMGRPDLRVGGKIFATLPEDGLSVNLKLDPETLHALVEADPATFQAIWGGRILGVDLGRVARARLAALLEQAWRQRAPPKLLAAGGSRGQPRGRRAHRAGR